jgi:hypothetical protein
MRALRTGNEMMSLVRGEAEKAGVKRLRARSDHGPCEAGLGNAARAVVTNSSIVLGVFENGRALGTIEVGATCVARDAAGRLLGEFENRKTAIRVFFEHGRRGTITVVG